MSSGVDESLFFNILISPPLLRPIPLYRNANQPPSNTITRRILDPQHPLFSQWTLYFSSPHVKNVPKTPSTAAAPAGQASGWMEDMRKVAKFDSVEEFWG
jgi:hypothetical protein